MAMMALGTGTLDSTMYDVSDEHDETINKFPSGLVEVHGLVAPVHVMDRNADAESPGAWAMDVNGLTGRAFWLAAEGKYLVHLRNDLLVQIAEENLREWAPPVSEEGGFDHLWPSTYADLPAFGSDIAKTLAQKNWCFVEYIFNDETRKAALEQAHNVLEDFHGPKREFLMDYLGHGGSGKIAFLPEWVRELPEEPLSQLNSIIELLSTEMAALSSGFMDAHCAERRPTFAWLPFKDRDESQTLGGDQLSEEDVEAGILEEHLIFIRQRKLGFMCLVDNDGGDLLLLPREDIEELWPVKLPVSPNKLLIYRADLMTFKYKPRTSRSLVLQTWLMEEPPKMDINNVAGSTELRSKALGIHKGIPQPVGDQLHCMSIALRTSGRSSSYREHTPFNTSGVDAQEKIPLKRFDIDLYSTSPDSKEPGKSYSVHGGFIDDITQFDNNFFKLRFSVVRETTVHQMAVLEEGYRCLHLSGYTQESLKGMNIGIYIGEVGSDTTNQISSSSNADLRDYSTHPDFMKHMFAGQAKSVTASRLSFSLQLKGPCASVDTACSASLVTTSLACKAIRATLETQGKTSADAQLTEAMPMGCNTIGSPWGHVGLSQGGMLSKQGRCFTFNNSADGYARNEACVAVHVKMSDKEGDVQKQLACIFGSQANQDGRSATLTAPSGPAQSALIKDTSYTPGLSPNQLNIAECHGTGTALGDPIEFGAIKNVMDARAWPVLMTSKKSNVGHSEAASGLLGVTKCIQMLSFGMSSPTCHLRELNGSIDNEGFPTLFTNEATDMAFNAGIAGVSAFGMGGTNARADIWNQTAIGVNKTQRVSIDFKNLGSCLLQVTCPVTLGPIDYLTGEPIAELAPGGIESVSARHRRSDVLRDPGAPYDISRHVYAGGFQYRLQESMGDFDEDLVETNNVRICGSWTGWKHLQKLEPVGGGWHSAVAAIGESRCESFFLCLGNRRNHSRIYPVVTNASPLIHIEGPDSQAKGRKWMIDGRDIEVPAGTFYEIRFRWGHLVKEVYWEPLEFEPEHPLPQLEHTYAVVGSFNSWTFQDMHPVPEKAGTWEAVGRIGSLCQEEFRFIRDHDWDQAIYPALPRTENPSVPVRGPDHMGEGKGWLVRSDPNSFFRLQLRIDDGKVQVEVLVEGQRQKRTWQSLLGWDRHHYYVVGSWNHWEPMPMVMDPEEDGLFRCRVTLKGSMLPRAKPVEYFQIIVDKDMKQAWYPREGDAVSGKQIACGPEEGNADGKYWMMQVPCDGAVIEINLDLAVDDRRRTVTWSYVSPPTSS